MIFENILYYDAQCIAHYLINLIRKSDVQTQTQLIINMRKTLDRLMNEVVTFVQLRIERDKA